MDDSSTHYKQGMKYWDEKKYTEAEEEFQRVRSLDSNYAPAYAGLALTTAQAAKTAGNVETAEEGFEEALQIVDTAQYLDSTIPEVFIAKAVIIAMKNEGKEATTWLPKVEEEYYKALKRDRKNAEAFYRRGCCYKNVYEFSKAADDFKKVIDLKKEFITQATKQWEIVQKIIRVVSGNEMSKKIALVEQVDRADIAALFVSELHIGKLIDKKTTAHYDTTVKAPNDSLKIKTDSIVTMVEVTDIDGHWAKSFIMDIVERGISGLEPYPDRTFRPDQTVNRGEYALMLKEVLIVITGNKGFAAKDTGTENRFPDVNPSHPAYNAICTTVGNGIMEVAKSGEFYPSKPLSGPDALLSIRNLKFLWLH